MAIQALGRQADASAQVGAMRRDLITTVSHDLRTPLAEPARDGGGASTTASSTTRRRVQRYARRDAALGHPAVRPGRRSVRADSAGRRRDRGRDPSRAARRCRRASALAAVEPQAQEKGLSLGGRPGRRGDAAVLAQDRPRPSEPAGERRSPHAGRWHRAPVGHAPATASSSPWRTPARGSRPRTSSGCSIPSTAATPHARAPAPGWGSRSPSASSRRWAAEIHRRVPAIERLPLLGGGPRRRVAALVLGRGPDVGSDDGQYGASPPRRTPRTRGSLPPLRPNP